MHLRETVKPFINLWFTRCIILKSFLEHCEWQYQLQFCPKEKKSCHTHTLFYFSHFLLTKHWFHQTLADMQTLWKTYLRNDTMLLVQCHVADYFTRLQTLSIRWQIPELFCFPWEIQISKTFGYTHIFVNLIFSTLKFFI